MQPDPAASDLLARCHGLYGRQGGRTERHHPQRRQIGQRVSNSIVPKITVIIGNSFGAGHYALCGKAYDPNFIVAWPSAKYAVMGGDQAAGTLFTVEEKAAERKGKRLQKEEADKRFQELKQRYDTQADIRYGAARGWVDAIIAPDTTRDLLIQLLRLVKRTPLTARTFHTGVIQT